MAARGVGYTKGQIAFLWYLYQDEECNASQVTEITGIPLQTSKSFAVASGATNRKTRLGAAQRVMLARKVADMRRKHKEILDELFPNRPAGPK